MDEMAMVADIGVLAGTTWTRDGDGKFAKEFFRALMENAPHDTVSSDSTAGHPYSLLLRKWLWGCDQNHTQCERPQTKEMFWPKRVIFVDDPNQLTLVEKQLQGEDYLVLSHCWGHPTEAEKKRFCTTRENYQDRLQGFTYDELPKTFQDAVRVTRLLRKQYLWIDALCIIQGPDGDWDSEARTMEDVFACAYCTIAASSARGWGDGFLKPNLDSSGIGLQGIPSTLTCDCDFDKDFTKLEPPFGRQYFILDPNFPDRLSQSGYQTTIDFIQFLFKKYSTSGLTFESDRDVAIYSLVERMRRVLRTEVRYGIVGCFLVPLLLWKRADEDQATLINYGDRTVPSWSWMAYPGGIDFISDVTQRLMVLRSADLEFTDNGDTLTVTVRRFKDCRIGQDGKQFAIFARSTFASPRKVGSLWFDVADRIEFKHCVIVGMDEDHQKEDPWKTYYFLLVREKQGGEGYERLGVGMVEARYVSKECDAGKLW
ncbi:hypothetical protein BFJ63_vAg18458 [Fusarium oxysporum f. sp. narcissi]|uniref:Heterokaryon incompatibility domain-containing protein n=1 Tax=Fusarium oxysporum f. sp. narcissi TaxID=451672 RepID=A0A4Q2V1L6_FUSOX|nr:hypothetical protein BFJ63_vAg18458 [Fusarium oxysporum f. sp. narcissi]